jgi:hypothetical protein
MAQMRFIQSVAVVASALALAACAVQWEKPGSTQQDLATDRARCENAAEREFSNRDEGLLQGWATGLDKRGYFEQCMVARGWSADA